LLYLSGVLRPDLPAMIRYGNREAAAPNLVLGLWAADNGCYAAPERFTMAGYLAWLHEMGAHHGAPIFATAPDVVGDASATMALSVPALPLIREVAPVALVGQDGLESLPVPWDDFDALFLGGTTEWKLSEAAGALAREAKARGKWVHMGRVNSLKRMVYAESIGCDSADGTVLKHDPKRPVHTWGEKVRNNPSLWRP
jgi:hypothetical protein